MREKHISPPVPCSSVTEHPTDNARASAGIQIDILIRDCFGPTLVTDVFDTFLILFLLDRSSTKTPESEKYPANFVITVAKLIYSIFKINIPLTTTIFCLLVSFVFPRVSIFPETKENEGKQHQLFPSANNC